MKKYRVIMERKQSDGTCRYEDCSVMVTNDLAFVFQLVDDAKYYGMDVRVEERSIGTQSYTTVYQRKGGEE